MVILSELGILRRREAIARESAENTDDISMRRAHLNLADEIAREISMVQEKPGPTG